MVKVFKIILWDVYGTLLQSRAGDLAALTGNANLLDAFRKTITEFDLGHAICESAPGGRPEQELRTLFLKRIEDMHVRKQSEGILHPEVRIEQIWLSIIESLVEHGYKHPDLKPSPDQLAREVAFFFERAANPKRLVAGVWETLLALRDRKVRQGLVTNAQFYTPIELGELFRIESNGRISTFHTIFDDVLVFLSCDFGFSKPNSGVFGHVRNVIWGEGLRVKDCLYVGNDMLNDVWCAKQSGFATALFAGDPDSVRWRKDDPRCANLEPDFVFHSLTEVLQCV